MKMQRISAALLTAAVLASPLAQAGALDNLKNSAGNAMKQQAGNRMSSQSGTAGSGALLSQLSSGSLNLGSAQNVAGVLGYCQKQGYAPSATDQVKSRLMSKIGGESQAQQDEGYKQGLSGILQGGNGQRFDLSNIKQRIGKKVCGHIADKAMSSFLGQ